MNDCAILENQLWFLLLQRGLGVLYNMCQIETNDEMACEDPVGLRIERFCRTALRKVGVVSLMRTVRRYRVRRMLRVQQVEGNPTSHSSLGLGAGDVVRIRSKEEIMKTLDEDDKLGGCLFMEEMWQYCGSQHEVFRRMEYFFDEAGCVMRKARNIVLLEDLRCSGNVMH